MARIKKVPDDNEEEPDSNEYAYGFYAGPAPEEEAGNSDDEKKTSDSKKSAKKNNDE